jgi:hypothetical protein
MVARGRPPHLKLDSGVLAMVRMADGFRIDLGIISPGEEGRVAWKRWQERLFKEELTRLGDRRDAGGGTRGVELCHQLVIDVVEPGPCRSNGLVCGRRMS